jgi:photosystem II stability/assembly factor-like uncharacterized protein
VTRAQLDLEKQLREYAGQYDREFATTAQMEQGIIARIATTPREARQAPTLRRELALAGLLLLFVGLLAVGIARVRALQQPVPAHPSPTAPYPGGASRSSSPFFVSPDVGWIDWSTHDSPSGALFKTTDAGNHWERQLTLDPGPEGACLLDVSATDGLYLCNRGSYSTSDGGAHWQRIALPAGDNFEFSFLNPHEAWSFSYVQKRLDGTCPIADCPLMSIFHTADGGQHWTEIAGFDQTKVFSHGDRLGYVGLTFRDSSSAWFSPIGAGPRDGSSRGSPYLYRTSDGGKTWREQALSATAGNAFNEVSPPHFFNDRDGVVLVSAPEGMYAYSTTDGGDHWSRPRALTIPVRPCLRPKACVVTGSEMAFGDAQHWFLRNGNNLARTSDGGQHWEVLSNGLPSAADFGSLDFVDATTGWAEAIGTTPQGVGGMYRTVDGGAHWTLVAFPKGG